MNRRAAPTALAAALAAAALAAGPQEPPKDVGMIERTSTRLAQVDVTVSGPKGAIQGLTKADFEVRVNGVLMETLIVDDLCVAQPVASPAAPPDAGATSSTAPQPPPESGVPTVATYMLYFDMVHLTQSGRKGAIDAAREMLPKLLAGGHRATIVVSAAKLKTIVPMTSDLAKLDGALVKLVDDNSAYDTYASLEERRMTDVVAQLDRGIQFAASLAAQYAEDERWKQEKELRRLSMVLGRLADLDSPKSVLYFADTMRQNAGEHYLAFFGESARVGANGVPTPEANAVRLGAETGALPLDAVMNEAAGLGVRFYTIEGQGMTGVETFTGSRRSASGGAADSGTNNASPALNFQRRRDAQTTLGSLAAETGGRAFINGIPPAKMAAQILGDMSCVYLVSFDPSDYPQDKPLRVAVKVKRHGVRSTTRGRLVVQSDAARLTGRVLGAFAMPQASAAGDASIRVGLIPIAYENGNFRARVQIALAGTPVPAATWDLGASLVSKGVVWQDASGRVQVSHPHTPVVFETDMKFAPGEYDLIAVAHETQSDTMASTDVHGTWPSIDVERATLGPIAVSQHRTGGFLRDGKSRTQGAVIVPEDGVLIGDSPTAVISLVCRAKDQKRPLRVVRTLEGETSTPVGTTELDLGKERCGQIVDLIPPRTLGAGSYRFVITVFSDGAELARGSRALQVPENRPANAEGAS